MIEFLTFTHAALLLIIGMITIVWIWLIQSQNECVHYLKDIKHSQREMPLNVTTLHNRLCTKLEIPKKYIYSQYISCAKLMDFIDNEKRISAQTLYISNMKNPGMKELHARTHEGYKSAYDNIRKYIEELYANGCDD